MLIKIGVVIAIVLVAYSFLQTNNLPVVIDGYYEPAFKPVYDKLKENLVSGKERGGSFAVYQNGKPLVHVWGGYADPEAMRPWRQDTMAHLWSTTKGIMAVVVAYMVERGYLDYSKPVGDYWPEFNQNGKEKITVEMLVTHRAGLPLLDTPIHIRDIIDNPEKYENILASQKPVWTPGTQSGYHMLTSGMFLDTLVRKADPKGRSVDVIFEEEIRRPFDIDVNMNLPLEKFHRTARTYSESPLKSLLNTIFIPQYFALFKNMLTSPNSLAARASKSLVEFGDIFLNNIAFPFNDPDVRVVPLTSYSGTGTAHGIAKLYSILASGGQLDGKTLLKPETIKRLFTPRPPAFDFVLERHNVTSALGVLKYDFPKGSESLYGHPGHGGQVGMADLENGLGIGYVTNFLSVYGYADDPRYLDLVETFYECLDEYKKN